MHIDRISGGGPIGVGCKLISVSGILSNGGCRIDVAAPGALVQIPQTGLHPRGDGVAKCGAAILKRQGHRLGVGGPVAPGAAHNFVGHGDLGGDGLLIVRYAVIVRILRPHRVQGGVAVDCKGIICFQNILGSSTLRGGDKFHRRSAPPQEHGLLPLQSPGVVQDRDRAAVLIGALRISGHGAGAAVAVIGHRVGGQTGDGGSVLFLDGQRILLAAHIVGQHGVAVGVVGVVAGKAGRVHVQGHLIGQGVGFGAVTIFGGDSL